MTFATSVVMAEPSTLPPEIGYNYGEMETPRSTALGGGLRALSNSTDALFLNPANIAATRVYHLSGVAQVWPQASRQSYGGAAVDSIVNRQGIAGGVGGTWSRQDPAGVDRQSFDVRFALAAPLSDQFLIGGTLRYLTLSENGYPRNGGGLPPSIASGGLRGDDIVADVTFDAGLALRPIPELSISLVGNNLTDTGYGFLPLLFGGGVGVGTELFSIEGDVVGDFTTYDDTTVRAMGGLEFLAGGSVPLRAGYRYDQGQGTQSISGGLGFLTESFSLDGAFRTSVQGPRVLTLVFGFKYHLDGAGVVMP